MGDKPRMRAVVLALVAAGCAERSSEAPVARTGATATPSGPSKLPAQPDEPKARPQVRKSGAEPRRELRYRPVVGSSRELEMKMTLDLVMMSGDHRMYTRNGDSHCRAKLTIAEVRDGAIKIDVEVIEMREPTYDPMDHRKVKLNGLIGWFTIDERGVLLSASPSLESAEAREFLYIMDYILPLPAEPVGVGAEWEVEQLAPRSGISMRNMQTFRIVTIEGDRVTAKMTEQLAAESQLVPSFEFDALSIFENVAITSGGTTDAEVSLDWPYPVRSENRFELGDDMFIHNPTRPSQPVRLTMNATVKATLK